MFAAMASCGSSLALSRGHPVSFRAPCGGRLSYLRPQAVVFRNSLGLKWVTAKPCSRRAPVMASFSGSENSTEIIDIEISNSSDDEGAPVQPRQKSGRPRKVKNIEGSSTSQVDGQEETEEDEEEWDFFGELATHIEKGSESGWTEKEQEQEEEHARTPNFVEAEVVGTTTDNANADITVESSTSDGSIPEAARPSFEGRQESKDEFLREEDSSDDEDDDIDFDDPKYQQKPDWMQDAVWQAIKNQGPGDDDDEGQPLWVDEEDPNWPEGEPEDGWGFKTSQFFDKISIKNDKSAEDDDEDDEELKMNWESEADDWMIREISTNEWEYSVFADPSPLVVYMFARYGRRGKDSWKMLEQLEKAVTSVWESGKAPLRAIKVDIGMEIDLGSALGINKDECPQLLFIKNGKGLYRLKDQRTSEELMQLMAHFFYNGKRPSFVDTTSSPESLGSVA
ncbi:hypothetical protein M758_4G135600 [Ceratodon purpureus]|nr:hypothetical protein M758_4G135600 [Ceratodon purpureus]